MSIKQVRVDVNSLSVGMFVSGLDCPWTQTPFPLQGFYIRDSEDIRKLQHHCKFVTIDAERKTIPGVTTLKVVAPRHEDRVKRLKKINSSVDRRSDVPSIKVPPIKVVHNHYPVKESLQREVKKAELLHGEVYRSVAEVSKQLQLGGDVSLRSTRQAASSMVDSVLRHPDALSWLSRVQEVDEYTYGHSVRSAIWAIIFGRHVGMTKSELDSLALGVLLKDIGKSKLDQSLLQKVKRSPEEEQEYRRFVDFGVEILREDGQVEPRIISVVKNHCERVNGTGFPLGIKGSKIPVSARIAGMVSYYDELTCHRDSRRALSPSKAVAKLYDCRNHEFQDDLVVEFIRAIGLYPTGTLVELSTGEVAVVVEQNQKRRLKPQVLVVLNARKEPLERPKMLDLAEDEKRKQALIDAGKADFRSAQMIEISNDLEVGAFGVDVASIREQYLFKKERSLLDKLFKRRA